METIYKKVKTRKAHSCFGCCEAIPKGAKAFYLTSFSNGKVTNDYLCTACYEVTIDLNVFNDDEFYKGEIKSEYPELWEQKRKELEVLK